MDIVVGGGGSLTDYHFAGHIRRSRGGLTCVDLSRTRFVDPFGLASVAAVLEDAVIRDRDIQFVEPFNDDCRHYLHRMGLGDVLDDLGLDHDLEPVRRHNTGDRLLRLQRFAVGEDAANELAEQVFRIFDAAGDTRAATLYDAVQEIAQNVVDHSRSRGGYIALQQFPKSNEVTFAVADAGIGLRRALCTAHTVRDDSHAIALAVLRNITSSGKEGRGIGLHNFVRHTRRSGRVQLWSGRSSGSFTQGRTVPRLTEHNSSFRGTVAQARLGLR